MKPRSPEQMLEDIEWMAANGEHLERVAARIGLKVSGLDKFLYRHNRTDLYRKLRADA